MKCIYSLIGLALFGSASLPHTVLAKPSQPNTSDTLRIATWNIEHLAVKNGTGCKPRNDADYQALRTFAQTLDADVVALQEVESAAAVARVFPTEQWDIIVSPRPDNPAYDCYGSDRKSTQQRVAFAINKRVQHKPVDAFSELGLDITGLRYGVVADIKRSGASDDDYVRLLSVHLKSGCFVNDYRTPNPDKKHQVRSCNMLGQQMPVMKAWITEQWKAGHKIVMLGDFNHRLTAENNYAWSQWMALSHPQHQGKLFNTMQNKRGCHPKYPAPIDHIILGPNASQHYVYNSVKVHYFGEPASMKAEDMLSDHCPISVQLSKK